MDAFYQTENIEIFKKWAYLQIINDPRLKIEIEDEQTYIIYYKDRVGKFVVWSIGIIEESIMEDENLLFYLHYQFYNFHFATDLFRRMIQKMTEEKSQSHKILLCCTGGMTTGFFAEKMNKYCHLNQLSYQIDATSVFRLQDIYREYDLILLAPQLRYKMIQLSKELKPVVVDSIDPVTFATYDCQMLLNHIEKLYKEEESV